MLDPRRWWALGAMSLSLIVIGLDLTVLNVALPTLATDLQASTSQLQWFANAYTLVLASLLLPAGLLGDRFGPKRLMLGALVDVRAGVGGVRVRGLARSADRGPGGARDRFGVPDPAVDVAAQPVVRAGGTGSGR